MTISPIDLLFYAGAVAILFLTPGPVWVALIARALSGGFGAAWPLALGVVVGDMVWPLIAIWGVSWIVGQFAGFMVLLRFVASAMFLVMGVLLFKHADKRIAEDSRLTRPGLWAGFAAGVAVILGNPKAVLFYMGVLPGFFDLSRVTGVDIAAMVLVSMIVPFAGNLLMAMFVDRARVLMSSPAALRRMNRIAGALLVLVGLAIPFL